MGRGYWILVWDGFGCGLNMIGARMYQEYDPKTMIIWNWWPADLQDDEEIRAYAIERHQLREKYEHFKVIVN